MADLLVLRAVRGKARTLNLNGKRLQRVPGAVGSLHLLTALQLKNNQLRQLPEEMVALRNLRVLHLGNNLFEKVPEEIQYLQSLQRLHLFGNRITEMPPTVCDGLENLVSLNLNNNLIEHIPGEMHKMKRLESLSINHNRLKAFPRELCLLQNLRELHLANNQIEALPEQMSYMINLTELRISRNKLSSLPEGLCKLKKLRILDVAGNQIQVFPSTMHEVPLQELYCEENPLLQKEPLPAVQDEEILSLKEITARLILRHLQSRDSILRQQIQDYPEAKSILSNRNVCALCGEWFLDMWLDCVKFVDVTKKMKTSSNVKFLPVRILLCSYKCFNQRNGDIFGVAVA
ncbi:leucine-rich repeat-containing protein 69 [Spea bombifrons]|uniref:leucine-rich repeat-containing protein 69 n=1 Tax=Spea bombifrons TaxID=233779 RepID=UPI00234A83A2|nr:leucine-rich repeat-containing protein 69 [Spea bombifrons]